MKRIITFMMALALVLSLGIAAFAAGDGSIKITNATIGVNYKLYKIFDATFVAGGTDANGNHIVDTVAYTLETSSPVYTYMFGTLTPDADGNVSNACFNYNVNTGVITKVDTADKDDITAYLTEMVRTLYKDDETAPAGDKCFVANQEATSQEVAFTGLDYGYYLIDTAKGTDAEAEKAKIAVTITTNTPSIEVIEKNQLPGGDFEKEIHNGEEWAENNSANIGDTVYFKLSFTATNYDDDRKVTYYTITDTLNPAEWADINLASIQIKILNGEGEADDIILTEGTAWNFVGTPSTDAFEIKIDWVDAAGEFKYDATEKVEVTYNAVVTAGAASNDGAQENKNEAELDWDSNTENPEEDETETDVLNLGFAKVDGSNTTIKLAGAEFALTDANGDAVKVTAELDTNGNKTGVYIVDKDATSNIIQTQADGEIIVKGLAAGTYYLEETKAPDGYNKLEGKTQVVVAADKATTYKVSYTANNANTEIQNNSGVELPSTGGKGTMMLITFGSVVAMAFAMLLITQKKMSIYRD